MRNKFEGDWIATRVSIERETWDVISELIAKKEKEQLRHISFAEAIRDIINSQLGLKHLIGKQFKGRKK